MDFTTTIFERQFLRNIVLASVLSGIAGTYVAARFAVVAVAYNIMDLYAGYKLNFAASAITIFTLALTLIIVKLLPLHNHKKAAA